jgi:hypothetical protein
VYAAFDVGQGAMVKSISGSINSMRDSLNTLNFAAKEARQVSLPRLPLPPVSLPPSQHAPPYHRKQTTASLQSTLAYLPYLPPQPSSPRSTPSKLSSLNSLLTSAQTTLECLPPCRTYTPQSGSHCQLTVFAKFGISDYVTRAVSGSYAS